jgi:hypothetical protein
MSHAILSPSSASKWLACTPSARLEQQFPDTAGEAAQEGTLCHECGELLIKRHAKQVTKKLFDRKIAEIEANALYNPDMREHAENYAAFVMERYAEAQGDTVDAVLITEQKLDMTAYVPDGFGTGDAIIISDKRLEIIDLKYGKGVRVSCENNKQMMLYALGASEKFSGEQNSGQQDVEPYFFPKVRMTIYQPRLDNISSFEMSLTELSEWAKTELKTRARLAFDGEGDFCAGDHCRFCRARTRCKALADRQLEIAKYEFAESILLTDAGIADILQRADAFKTWINAIEAYALAEAINNGKKWEGFKLVEGRSVRAYLDPTQIASVLLEKGYQEGVLYTKSLLGITALEKLITKKNFEMWLGDYVVKPQGKPTLVPESDKRMELGSAASAAEDFKD